MWPQASLLKYYQRLMIGVSRKLLQLLLLPYFRRQWRAMAGTAKVDGSGTAPMVGCRSASKDIGSR